LPTIAAHGLDQNGQLQLAAPHHLEGVRPAGLLNADRYVGEQLFIQALAQVARRNIPAFSARERRGIDGKRHRYRGFIDLHLGQGPRRVGIGDRFSDRNSLDAGDRQNVSRFADGFFHALQTLERVEFRDAGLVQ